MKFNINTYKVLPTIYQDALSYDETLNKVCYALNALIDFFNGTLEQELKDYIEKEFNNMMMNAMYDPETETLSLYLVKVG